MLSYNISSQKWLNKIRWLVYTKKKKKAQGSCNFFSLAIFYAAKFERKLLWTIFRPAKNYLCKNCMESPGDIKKNKFQSDKKILFEFCCITTSEKYSATKKKINTVVNYSLQFVWHAKEHKGIIHFVPPGQWTIENDKTNLFVEDCFLKGFLWRPKQAPLRYFLSQLICVSEHRGAIFFCTHPLGKIILYT